MKLRGALLLGLLFSSLAGQCLAMPATSLTIEGFTNGGGSGDAFRNPRDIQVLGGYAYVTDQTNNGVVVVDLHTPTAPQVVTLSAGNCGGAFKESISGNTLFAACSTENAVKVFDISDATHPKLLDTVSGPNPGVTLKGVTQVYVDGKYLYALSRQSVAMTIFDISDPASPTFVSQTPLAGSPGNQPLDVKIRGNDAFVLTNDGLYVYNVSNPANPALLGFTLGPVPGTSLDQARAIQLIGNYALLAVNQDEAVATIDISDPSHPTYIDSFYGPDPHQTFYGITDIWVSGNIAYTTNDIALTVSTLDITDPTNISWLSDVPSSIAELYGVQQLASDGEYLYYISFDDKYNTAGVGVLGGNGRFDNPPFVQIAAVPESATLALFGSGLVLLAGVRRRRRNPVRASAGWR